MASKRRKSKKLAARRAHERPERQQDPRLIATRALRMNGQELPGEHWVVAVSPVHLPDGRKLMWHSPQPVAFNLIQAEMHRDRGGRRRRAILGNLKARGDGGYMPLNSRVVMDCVGELSAAVLFAFTAIESLANHAIEMLPDDFTLGRKEKSASER